MITTKVIKPHSCLLVIAIPLTREEFLRDLDDPGKDFAKSRQRKHNLAKEALWEIDYEPLTHLVNELINVVSKFGVKVITGFKSSDFFLISNNYDVFTVFAHWVEGIGVELCDGLISPGTFEQCLPQDFANIIDLTICESTNLQDVINDKRNNIVVANKRRTPLEYRLIQYKGIIQLINYKNYNYIDAITEIRKGILSV